jgi:hypothetical protein
MGKLGVYGQEWVETDMVVRGMRLKVGEVEARRQQALLASVPAGEWPSVSGRTRPASVRGLQRSYSAAAAGRIPQAARVPQAGYIPARYPQASYGSVGVQQGSYGPGGVYQPGYGPPVGVQQPAYTYISPAVPANSHGSWGREDAPFTPEREGPGWGLTTFVGAVVRTVLSFWEKW